MMTAHKCPACGELLRLNYQGQLACVCGHLEPAPLLDQALSDAGRDAGRSQSYDASPTEFRDAAFEVVRYCAENHAEFLVDLPRQIFEQRHPDLDPRERRSWGGVMRRAHKAGLIKPAGRSGKSAQVKSHSTTRGYWRSALIGGPIKHCATCNCEGAT